MKWFKEKELCCKCSQDSQARMSNCGSSGGQLPPFIRENMEALVQNVLDPLRERYGKPIIVNSGYRCPKHNREVGGATNSQHLKGEAADIRVQDSRFTVKDLAKAIIEHGKYDQLILYPTFVHVSWKRVGLNRREVLEKTANGYRRVRL